MVKIAIQYSKKVIDHFTHPRNVGEMEDYSGKSMKGNPACGDLVTIYLKVDNDDGVDKISDIKFKSYGCASNIATCSVVTELANGLKVEDAKKITWKQVNEELEGLPPVKIHCSVLAVDTLLGAIEDYEIKSGKKKNDDGKNMKDKVYDELSKVINPETGKNIIDDKIIKDINIGLKKIIIDLDIDDENMYNENIKEEIQEHLDGLFSEIIVRN